MIVDLAEELELNHVCVHEEAINNKINMILWMHPSKYDKIVPLLGGFQSWLAYLMILYKKYVALDYKIDAGAIAESSVMQTIQGRHYVRGISLHKQSFCKIYIQPMSN